MPDWEALGPFIYNWVVVALSPVWLVLVISFIVTGATSETRPALPVAAALFAYALALTAAFFDDISLKQGTSGFAKWLRPTSASVKWLAVALGSCAITVLSLQDVSVGTIDLTLSSGDTLLVSALLAGSCLVISLCVVLFMSPSDRFESNQGKRNGETV